MELLGIAGIGTITVVCYLIGLIVKASGLNNKWIPIICGISGGLVGVYCMYTMSSFPATDPVTAVAIGIVSGLAATGVHQTIKQLTTKTEV